MSKKLRNNDESSSLDVVERFDTYEDYLDSQLTATDMNYLEDEEMARQLVELGYRGLGDTIRRDVRKFLIDPFHVRTGCNHLLIIYIPLFLLSCRTLRHGKSCCVNVRTRNIRYQNN